MSAYQNSDCWFFHEWLKWEPAAAEAHAYQHKVCRRCGKRAYRTVGLGG